MLLRYSIFVEAAGRDFVQWGQTWEEIMNLGDEGMACGPDVHWEGQPPAEIGICGLTHSCCSQSGWQVRATGSFIWQR